MKQELKKLLFVICCFLLLIPGIGICQQETTPNDSQTISSIRKIKSNLREESNERTNTVAAAVESLPPKKKEAVGKSQIVRLFQGLGICLAVFCIGIAIAKKINPKLRIHDSRRLTISSRISLSNKTQLLLVDFDGEELLLTVGQEQVSVVRSNTTNQLPEVRSASEVKKVTNKDGTCAISLQQSA